MIYVVVAVWVVGAIGWLLFWRGRRELDQMRTQLENARAIVSASAAVSERYRTARLKAEADAAAARLALETELEDIDKADRRIKELRTSGDAAEAINEAFGLNKEEDPT